MTENQQRIQKAINFFRQFHSKSDREIYRKSVLKFCDLIETELHLAPIDTTEQDVEKALF